MPKPNIDRSQSLAKLLQDRDELLSHLIDALDSEDTEQAEITQEVLDEIILPALAVKFDGLAHTIKYGIPTKIDEMKAWKEAIAAKQKTLELTLDAIKERLKYYHSVGKVGDVMQGEISSISISDGSLSVDDSDAQVESWGHEWREYFTETVVYKIDKKAILAAYKSGKLSDDTLPPGIVIKNGQRLTVKIKE